MISVWIKMCLVKPPKRSQHFLVMALRGTTTFLPLTIYLYNNSFYKKRLKNIVPLQKLLIVVSNIKNKVQKIFFIEILNWLLRQELGWENLLTKENTILAGNWLIKSRAPCVSWTTELISKRIHIHNVIIIHLHLITTTTTIQMSE